MRRLLLLLLIGLVPAPLGAQDDDGSPATTEEEKERIRRKNRGQGLGGQGQDEGDEGAPKVKASLQERINTAIKNGVAFLKKRQLLDGSWGPCRAPRRYSGEKGDFVCYKSGPTSWTIYTLSKCGVVKSDPVIKKGYNWLGKQYFKKQSWDAGVRTARDDTMVSYEISSLIMMLEAMHTRSAKVTVKRDKKGVRKKVDKRLLTQDPLKPPRKSPFNKAKQAWEWMHLGVRWLTVERVKYGKTIWTALRNRQGGWRYGSGKDRDMSATQFVLLALRAASQAGYPVKRHAWVEALKYIKAAQNPDGGWGYQLKNPSSDGMTAAGLACAIICKEQLSLTKEGAAEVPAWLDESIKKGLARLDRVFDIRRNRGKHHGGSYHYYYLYGIERIGDLTGRREFNGKDWYVRGAEFLLANQDADGKWVDSTGMQPHDVLGTCFALLFLKRATPPAVTMTR